MSSLILFIIPELSFELEMLKQYVGPQFVLNAFCCTCGMMMFYYKSIIIQQPPGP